MSDLTPQERAESFVERWLDNEKLEPLGERVSSSEIEIVQTRAGRWSAWYGGKLLGWTATSNGGRSWQVYVRLDESQQAGELVDSAPDRETAVAALRRALSVNDEQ